MAGLRATSLMAAACLLLVRAAEPQLGAASCSSKGGAGCSVAGKSVLQTRSRMQRGPESEVDIAGDDTVMIKSAFDDRCLIFGGNGDMKHPERHSWGHNNAYCDFPSMGGKSEKDSLLDNKQAVWKIQHLEGDQYMIKSVFDDRCLIFGGNGDMKNPERHSWGHNNAYCGFPSVGGKSEMEGLLDNKQAVWKIQFLDKFMIKSAFDDRCLIFGGNGDMKNPERHSWGHNNAYCDFPSLNGKSEEDSLLDNKQGVWKIQHLEDDKYMIKSGFDNQCLIFSNNGYNKHPERHSWGHNNAYCGFPSMGGKSERESLLDNKQAVWKIQHLEGDKYMIKSAFDDRCLIFGGNGDMKHPERHSWGHNNAYCDFPSMGGKSEKDSLLDNKQAVWKIQDLSPAVA